jgi:FtsP/CotA-like multicopper oxidase with cupredoxin domain
MNADTIPLLTMGMETLDMEPDNPGIWSFHCHVGVHFEAGMAARYQVLEAE